MAVRDIIVIGASAGRFEAIQTLAGSLPADLPAAVFVTLHIYERSEGILPALLNGCGPLLAAHAEDGEAIRAGRIYVAKAASNSQPGSHGPEGPCSLPLALSRKLVK